MERIYLALAVVGFLVPGSLMPVESVETGNILFWTNPARTNAELFANRTSTTFALDLFLAVLAAFVFMWYEGRRVGIANVWRFWLLAMLFGLAGTLSLFLYARERRLAAAAR